MNDDTDKIEQVRCEYEGVGRMFTSYVPSLIEPQHVRATTKSKTTVPQGVGTKEQRIDDER